MTSWAEIVSALKTCYSPLRIPEHVAYKNYTCLMGWDRHTDTKYIAGESNSPCMGLNSPCEIVEKPPSPISYATRHRYMHFFDL